MAQPAARRMQLFANNSPFRKDEEVPGTPSPARRPSTWLFGIVVPLLFIVVILGADVLEGPKTAYVGVLSAIPLLAAIFGSPWQTALVSIITWLSAWVFGLLASDGNATAQTVRLGIIAIVGLIAVGAAWLRSRREAAFLVAQQRAAEAQMRHLQATQDHLTGLRNRRGMLEALELWPEGESTVAVIDCDNLKAVNDTRGHLAGDDYLLGVAGRLAHAVASDDMVARWGGDEFLIALRLPYEEAGTVLERVHASVVASPVKVGDGLLEPSYCCGFARFTSYDSLDESIAAADRAMYAAKRTGPNSILGSED